MTVRGRGDGWMDGVRRGEMYHRLRKKDSRKRQIERASQQQNKQRQEEGDKVRYSKHRGEDRKRGEEQGEGGKQKQCEIA